MLEQRPRSESMNVEYKINAPLGFMSSKLDLFSILPSLRATAYTNEIDGTLLAQSIPCNQWLEIKSVISFFKVITDK